MRVVERESEENLIELKTVVRFKKKKKASKGDEDENRTCYVYKKPRVGRLMNNSWNNEKNILLFPLLSRPQGMKMISFARNFGGLEGFVKHVKCIRKTGGNRRKFIKARKRGNPRDEG